MYAGPLGHCENLADTVQEMGGPERFEQSNDMILVIC